MPEAPDLEVIKDYLNANLKDAAVVSGFSETDIRGLINRERLFPEMKRQHGKVLSFSLRQLFTLAAVKSLISVGFPIRSACDAIRDYAIYGSLVHGTEISLAVGKDGRLIGLGGARIAVSIVIRPWALFQDMKAGLIEVFGPEAVDELEQKKTVKPASKKPRKKGAT